MQVAAMRPLSIYRDEVYKTVKDLISSFDDPIKKNIYLVPVYETVQSDLFSPNYDKVSLKNIERVH